MFNFTKFWLYINMGINLSEQQYIGFFQFRAEEVSLKGTEAEGFELFSAEILDCHN